MPHTIGLIVTGPDALKEYEIFVKTLDQWHSNAHLCIFTDSETEALVLAVKRAGKVSIKVALDAYKGLRRTDMEAKCGVIYNNLFKDFCYEKANVLEWMFDTQENTDGFWFIDCDISFLAPLPQIPESSDVALCPHYIRPADEKLYGKYNAGLMWVNNKSLLKVWRDNGHGPKFLDQSALEDVARASNNLYEFPIQVNFGWWRMFQSLSFPADVMAKFSLFRADQGIGIRYDGKPLQSIHTHWNQKDSATGAFNVWFDAFILKFTSHKPIAQYRKMIGLSDPKATTVENKKKK